MTCQVKHLPCKPGPVPRRPLRAARRSQRQKWELAAAALEHLGLALEAAPAPGPAPALSGREAPGAAVMLDLLGEREAARAAWGSRAM